MIKSMVYQGDELLGEVEIYFRKNGVEEYKNKSSSNINSKVKLIEEVVKERIRINCFSQPSERCPPLAVLHTISSNGFCFKMESSSSSSPDMPLSLLHNNCIRENKTAVMPVGGMELHLVAMFPRNNDRQFPFFWGFCVRPGLYNSCLVMLNLRCLGIVFDLDETLVVANTMRSFEDRIEALQRKISVESDQQRISCMIAEVKRYQDDKSILKQYVESDQVVDNGEVIKIQPEIVPALSDHHQPIIRPIIRLQEKNIILTRINPQIRDTSVLVRLRPAWEELRNYLTAKGRKRFEVYVCTMAERDYALEMWRLLDPDSNLISTKELLDRIVCVKSGLKKSLLDVFQDGTCDPKMALVIDDRLKVWDEEDQPRVHVVPAFAPYYAPQAEVNNPVPILCVARNVACSVRGGFFKDFDDMLLQRISEVAYEDDISAIPPPPDVSNYLVEDEASAPNGNKDPLSFDGMADAEVERRLKDAIAASATIPSGVNIDPRILATLQSAVASISASVPLPTSQAAAAAPVPFPSMQYAQIVSLVKQYGQASPPEQSMQSSPAREEGEVPESELDPDTRRRLLILQHGQDNRDPSPSEPPLPVRPSLQVPVPNVPSHGNWFPVEEEMSPRQLTRPIPKEYPLDSDIRIEKQRVPPQPSFYPKIESSPPPERIFNENQRLPKGAQIRDDRMRLGHSPAAYQPFQGDDVSLRASPVRKNIDSEAARTPPDGETSAVVLQEIARKCGAKVEYKSSLVSSMELQFAVEAWFAGEKIGEGTGKTRREAQTHAAEKSLRHLANIYMGRGKPDSGIRQGDVNRTSGSNENEYLGSINSFSGQQLSKEESPSYTTAVESSRFMDSSIGPKNSMDPVFALKELCFTEGLGMVFQAQPQVLTNSLQQEEVHAQIEVDGQVMGRGVGLTWDEARAQAAERALVAIRSMLGQFPQKRQASPRSLQEMASKRLKPEFPRLMQRVPSSGRYPRNAPPVP